MDGWMIRSMYFVIIFPQHDGTISNKPGLLSNMYSTMYNAQLRVTSLFYFVDCSVDRSIDHDPD